MESSSRKKKTVKKFRIIGVVQGVGFRPAILKKANLMGITGAIRNTTDGVELFIYGDGKIETFLSYIEKNFEIINICEEKVDKNIQNRITLGAFKILASKKTNQNKINILPPDRALCPQCESEFFDEKNKRFRHPFISCQKCGPRYSIVYDFPYDRKNTSMGKLKMCKNCEIEYSDKKNRRYHAQTISCLDCPPNVLIKGQNILSGSHKFNSGILLVKSVSGYHLVCSVKNERALNNLRKIKDRDMKPFAIMFQNIAEIKKHCEVSKIEEKELLSSARPIVLLKRKRGNISKLVYGQSDYLGVMLPSMGLHFLLLEKESPLVFTSANLKNEPVLYKDEDANALFQKNKDIKSLIYYERPIITGLDDTVVHIVDKKRQFIRRARGFVPLPIKIGIEKQKEFFCSGADMKSVFAFHKNGYVYMSGLIGEFSKDSIKLKNNYKQNFLRMKNLFDFNPKHLITDAHFEYISKKNAKELLKKSRSTSIYHHHAHIASVIAEHKIEGKVIGIALDGTGLGDDGNIWGGEILIGNPRTFERFKHLKYVKLYGNDIASKNALLPAMAYLEKTTLKDDEFEIDLENIINFFKKTKYKKVVETYEPYKKLNSHLSSSMGRLFDAVSYMLGICDKNEYEGQCAINLEQCASNYKKTKSIKNKLAFEFHMNLIKVLILECESAKKKTKINKVCLSGGCFQNKILTEGLIKGLTKRGFEVFINEQVPVNDGGIALGQAYIALNQNI